MKRYIYFIVAFLLICSCEPKDKYYYVNLESKEWALYKPGSWWVYQDSVSKIEDSLFVTNYNESFSIENSDKTNYNYQTFQYATANSTAPLYSYSLFCSFSNTDNFNKYISSENKTYKTVLTYFTPSPESSAWSSVNTLSEYIINGITYNNVLHIRAGYSEQNDASNKIVFYHDYWLAKGTGFIKMVDRTPTDTTVWLLQKYNAIQ